MVRNVRILSNSDIGTPCWRKLKDFYSSELADMRRRIENPRMLESERIALCWKIEMVKGLLSLGDSTQKDVTDAGE